MSWYRVRPIERWPVAKTASWERRSKFVFSASWASTLKLLESELCFLDATQIIIQIDIKESDLRVNGTLRASANPSFPGVIVCFQSKIGPLSYPCDSCDFWQHNVRSVALALKSLRAVDRYGVTSRSEQYRGWQQIPGMDQDITNMTPEEAHAIMAAFNNDVLKAKRKTHPDHGGSKESFKRVINAIEILGLKA